MYIKNEYLESININDCFFDSLKQDYKGFENWFQKKQLDKETAYVCYGDIGIEGFLYLKKEFSSSLKEEISFLNENLILILEENREILKVGTFKIEAHGTRLGERFIKKIFDHAMHYHYRYVYVTIFEKHVSLLTLLKKYGFRYIGIKQSISGTEQVYLKTLKYNYKNILENFPRIETSNDNAFWLLSIWPKYHTKLFPDSILRTESQELLQDISHTNSIHKIYLSHNPSFQNLREGDLIIIYRSIKGEEHLGTAKHKAVCTSICVVEETISLKYFRSRNQFINYCRQYSIFDEIELDEYWQKRNYSYLVKFTYNIALPKRVIRFKLLEEVGITSSRLTLEKITRPQFLQICLQLGETNESFIIN